MGMKLPLQAVFIEKLRPAVKRGWISMVLNVIVHSEPRLGSHG